MTWLELSIIQRAIIASVLAGFLTGLVSVLVVRMKLSSIGYCMSHAAFAGAALGVASAVNPITTAFLLSSAIALLIGPVADKAKLHVDTITSIAFPLNIALAFIFLTLSPSIGLTSEVGSILWGSVLSITSLDAFYLTLICSLTIGIIVLFWKELFAIMFNRRLAEADGINVKPIIYFIIFLIGIVVTFLLKLVGGLLIFALLFNPASTALQFLYNIKKIIIVAPVIGILTCLTGFFLSLLVNLPVGSSIVIISTLTFAIAVIFSPKRKKEVRE